MNGSTVDQYKATVTCSKALLTPNFRGYGPVSNEFLRHLEKWSRNAAPKLPSTAKPIADSPDLKVLASGATLKMNTPARLKRLEAMYERQVAPKGGDFSLESLMTDRMKRILKAKEDKAQSGATAKGEIVKLEKSSLADDKAFLADQEAAAAKGDKSAVKEEGTADGVTDTEDVKPENQTIARSVTSSGRNDHDDDMLTSMSLHEDLEIFDGLQFEDGGGIIDMSFQSLGSHKVADNDSVKHNFEDADGTDVPGQDDDGTMDEEMVDDDEDENDDSRNQDAEREVPQQGAQSATEEENDNNGDATTDFPEM